jgi:2,5-diketo-D-gluconate reductase B
MMELPLVGLGTWQLRGRECTRVVRKAISMGYRHIDTAHVYENHAAIGKALKDFDRSHLFLTSKIALEQIDLRSIASSVEKACDLALKELDVDYLDLYLLHFPDHTLPMAKIFKAIDKLVKKKKIRRAGVSNCTVHHLKDLLKEKCHPSANQVEFHPYLYQKDLWKFCRSQEIRLIAYRSLGKKQLLSDPVFKRIGKKHGKSPAQVILRWLVQKEIPVIPKAASEKHLRENLEIFEFTLTKAEMLEIDRLNKFKRFCMPDLAEFNY